MPVKENMCYDSPYTGMKNLCKAHNKLKEEEECTHYERGDAIGCCRWWNGYYSCRSSVAISEKDAVKTLEDI